MGEYTNRFCPLDSPPVTLLELAPAAAGTGVVAPGPAEQLLHAPVLLGQVAHNIGGCAAVAQFVRHKIHVRAHVIEEGPVARAQVIEARFAVWREDEAVFGAAAVADELHFALQAIILNSQLA